MKDEYFEQLVRKEVGKLREKFGCANLGDAFVLWALKNLWSMEDIETFSAEVGQEHDKGVDALWVDEENEMINILQGKFFDNLSTKLETNEFLKLTNSPKWLEKTSELVNKRLIEKSGEFCEARKKSFSINFILLIFGQIGLTTLAEIKMFNEKIPEGIKPIEYYDYPKIKDLYELTLSAEEFELPKEIELTFSDKEFYEKKTKDAIIGTIPISELARIEAQYHFRLFHKNVRYFLGKKTSVNKQIIRTLSDPEERNNFWYYNNGVTIVCDDYEIINNKENTEVLLKGLQIINGCQTTVAIASCRDLLSHSEVMVRIFKSKGEKFAMKVCETTNTQTAVKGRDLRSLDPIQRQLKKQFKNLGYYYEIKRFGYATEKSVDRTPYKAILNNQKVAKAYLAFIGHPSDARARLYRLFDKNEYYPVIFPENKTASELLLPYLIIEGIEEAIKEKKKQASEDFDFLRYSEFMILAGIGYFMTKHYFGAEAEQNKAWNSVVSKNLLNSEHFEGFRKIMFEIFAAGLRRSIESERKRLGDNYSHEVYLKRQESFKNLVTEIESFNGMMEASGLGGVFVKVPWPDIS